MRLWRISRRASFDGEGARRAGGRWNHPGTVVIYAAATLALATLEFLVHLERERATAAVFAHYADVPDDAATESLNEDRLPPGWHRHRAPAALREIGTTWAMSASTVLLAVPSAVLRISPQLVPAERNYLLNPAHPDFARVRVRSVSLRLDPRMWT